MEFSPLDYLSFSVEKQGPKSISKASFPLRYGTYSDIKTADYEFLFNLNGEIKFIRGLNDKWPHPVEQLKRTDGNDWVYYSVGDKSGEDGVISWLGEYYLPCLPYPSNAVWELDYLSNPAVMNAFAAWSQLYADLYMGRKEGLHAKVQELIGFILKKDDQILHERSKELNGIIGERVSVLPPDTRHVDYEIIPLIIADGCLYQCKFCCVKSENRFHPRKRTDILHQLRQLKRFYGRNLENYNALFMGNHDALATEDDLLLSAASEAYSILDFEKSGSTLPLLFLFASVHSLLNSKKAFFDKLETLPFYAYINIGFESVDEQTLGSIGKPIKVLQVREAFQKMLEINEAYKRIEITGNFLLGEQLRLEHYQSLLELLKGACVSSHNKGSIYLSPLKDSPKKRELLPQFYELKELSKLPVFIYLIQRL